MVIRESVDDMEHGEQGLLPHPHIFISSAFQKLLFPVVLYIIFTCNSFLHLCNGKNAAF